MKYTLTKNMTANLVVIFLFYAISIDLILILCNNILLKFFYSIGHNYNYLKG